MKLILEERARISTKHITNIEAIINSFEESVSNQPQFYKTTGGLILMTFLTYINDCRRSGHNIQYVLDTFNIHDLDETFKDSQSFTESYDYYLLLENLTSSVVVASALAVDAFIKEELPFLTDTYKINNNKLID